MQNEKLLQLLQDLTQKVNAGAEQTGQKLEDFVKNEDALRPILIATHARFPLFMRMLFSEAQFVEFIMQNKEKLLIHQQIGQIVEEIIGRFFRK